MTVDSTPAGLPPAGRCDGIAGDAETTTGPPEVGRLDRLLAAHHDFAGRLTLDSGLVHLAPGQYRRGGWDTSEEIERLRSMVVALESEVAALTDALGDPALTHEYEPAPWSGRICGFVYDDDGADCCMNADHPIHRTPARVRAELEGQR